MMLPRPHRRGLLRPIVRKGRGRIRAPLIWMNCGGTSTASWAASLAVLKMPGKGPEVQVVAVAEVVAGLAVSNPI